MPSAAAMSPIGFSFACCAISISVCKRILWSDDGIGAAVHRNDRTGDVARLVGSEEQDDASDFFRRADAAERNLRFAPLQELGFRKARHFRLDGEAFLHPP